MPPDAENSSLRAEVIGLRQQVYWLREALNTVPAALMLAVGPPYRLTLSEEAVKLMVRALDFECMGMLETSQDAKSPGVQAVEPEGGG